MALWGIVPVKMLDEAKSSLARALDPETRRSLVLAMLQDVISALLSSPSLSGCTVVSPDPRVTGFAEKIGARGLLDGGAELNRAIGLAIEDARTGGASSVIILPGDVPLVKPGDLENMAGMATGEREVVISPSKANGTNALLIRPPHLIGLRFGGESFPLHLQEAAAAGVTPRIYRSHRLANDLDDPEDIELMLREGRGTRTYEVLTRARIGTYLSSR